MAVKMVFGHKARSGKDTAGEFLVNKYGGEIFKFAKVIYDIHDYAIKRAGLNISKDSNLLQHLGTAWGRAIDPDIWVKACLKDISTYIEETRREKNVFITDCRFTNEADALKKQGFYLVKVHRDTLLRGDIGRDANHASEIDLDSYQGWDCIIENNGTLQEFHEKIDSLYKRLHG